MVTVIGRLKRLQIVCAYCLLAVLSGACGQPAASPTAPAATVAAPGPAVVADQGAGRPVSFMVFGDPAELRAYQQLVAAYQAAYPGARVELIHVPNPVDYRKRLGVDFAAGAPADVVLLNYRRYAGFAAKGLLEPLGPYLDESSLISETDFFPESLYTFRWGADLMCVPQNVASLAVYYNKDLFDQAGLPYPDSRWTWDDFVLTALALTRDFDGDGRTDQHGLGIEPSLNRLAPFIWQNRGTLVDSPAAPRMLALEQPASLQAVEWFVDLQVTHRVVPDAAAEAAEHSENRFLNGRLAMFVNSRRGVPTYREITAFDWDVAPLPMNRGRQTNVLHADAYCMAATAPNKPAVWQFIEFANSAEGQTIVARSGRTVPSLISVAQSPAFLDPQAKPANSQQYLDAIAQVRAVPVVEDWADIEQIASDEIKRAFYGQASLQQAMRSAVTRTGEYFHYSFAYSSAR